VDLKKIEAMQNCPLPKILKSLRGFLCLTGYYHKFIQNYGKFMPPLTTILKNDAFNWTPTTYQSFQALKDAMGTTPVLALPEFSKTFVLECDALGRGIRAVLMQDGCPLDFTNK